MATCEALEPPDGVDVAELYIGDTITCSDEAREVNLQEQEDEVGYHNSIFQTVNVLFPLKENQVHSQICLIDFKLHGINTRGITFFNRPSVGACMHAYRSVSVVHGYMFIYG